MGKRIITNNIDKWEIFSTVTDSVEATFTSEKDLKYFLAIEIVYDGKLKAIEKLMSFPFHCSINDVDICRDNFEGKEKYFEWYKSESQKAGSYEEYYKAIDEKLEELLGQQETKSSEEKEAFYCDAMGEYCKDVDECPYMNCERWLHRQA